MWCFTTLYSSLKEHLLDSFIGSLEEIKIPDTIIFDEESNPIAWYYSPKELSGVKQKKSKDVIRAKIFRSLVENSDYVIVANIIWYDNNELGGKIPQLRVRYLDEHELRQLLLGSDSGGKPLEKLDDIPPLGTRWILQKFIALDSRGCASTICSECIGGQRFSIKRITNNHYFHGHSRKHDACLTVECYDVKHIREERTSEQTIKSCSDISEIVQQCLLKDSISTRSINLYFSQDKIGRIWLKWALFESNTIPSIYISENSNILDEDIQQNEVDSRASFRVNKQLAEALCSIYEKVFGVKKTSCYQLSQQSIEYHDPYAIELLFDAKVIKYEEILDMFWNKMIDPSFNKEIATIYYYEDSQKVAAESSAWRVASTHKCMLNASIESIASFPLALDESKQKKTDGIAFQKSHSNSNTNQHVQLENLNQTPLVEINMIESNDAQQTNDMSDWNGAWQSAMEVDQNYNKTKLAQESPAVNPTQPALNPVPPAGTKPVRPTSAAQRAKVAVEPIVETHKKGNVVDDSDTKSVEMKDKSPRYEQMSKPKLKPALAIDRQKVIELNHIELQKIETIEDPIKKSKKKFVPKNKYAKLLRKSKWIMKKRNEKKKEVVLPGWVSNTYIDYKSGSSRADTVLLEFEDRVKREMDLISKEASKHAAIHIPTAPPSAPSSRNTSAKSFRRPTSNDSNLDLEDDNKSSKSKKSMKKPDYDEIKPAEVLEQSKEFGKRLIRQKPLIVLPNGKEIFGPKPKPPPLPPPGMPEELIDIVGVIVHNVCANLFSCLDKSKDIAIFHREGLQLSEKGIPSNKRLEQATMDKIVDFLENGPKVNSSNPESVYQLPLSDPSGKAFIEALQLISCTPNHRPTSDLITIVLWILSSERNSSSDEKEFADIIKSFAKYTSKAKKLIAEVASICQGRGPTKEKEDKPRWNAAVKLQTWYDRRHAPKVADKDDDDEIKSKNFDELELTGVDFVNSINSPQFSHLTMNSKSQALSIKNGNTSPRGTKASKDPRNNGSSNITSSIPLSQEQDDPLSLSYFDKNNKSQKQIDEAPNQFREMRRPITAGIIHKLGGQAEKVPQKKKVFKSEELNLQVHLGMEAMLSAAKWTKNSIFDNRDESNRNEMLMDDFYEEISSVPIDGIATKSKNVPKTSGNQNSEIITLNSETMGLYGETMSTPLHDKSLSSLSNNVMIGEDDDDDLAMTLSPMSPPSMSGSSLSPPKEKSMTSLGQSATTPQKSNYESKSFVMKESEDKEIMFHRLAPKINSLQRKMFIVSLVSDSARTLILCVLVLIKHTQAGKEVKFEDLLNLFGKPVARKIGQTNLLALLRWLKANRRSEMNFIPSHERYLEFALQRLFAFWPDAWVNVAEVDPNNLEEDLSNDNQTHRDEHRELSKQVEASKIIPLQPKQMKTTVRLKWPDKFRVTKLFLEPHALEPNLNFI